MKYAVCAVPVSPVRKDASHKSEMVSQFLFGECCTFLQNGDDNWVKIKCRYDDYEGWCQLNHFVDIDEEDFKQADKNLADEWVNELDYNGQHMYVPMGSSLTSINKGRALWGKNSVQYSGKIWKPDTITISEKLIKQIAFKFLNTAYMWGGRSVFGIDCSGFTQMVYKFLNIPLPRDAWQQAGVGNMVISLQAVVCGDLAFFENAEGKITHVGIVLSSTEIIHSAGKVRLDNLDKEGIIHAESKNKTHSLKMIRRYFQLNT